MPLIQYVAHFETVMVLVNTANYCLQGPGVLHLQDLRLCILFLNFRLEVVSIKLVLVLIMVDLCFDCLNQPVFIVQILNQRSLFDDNGTIQVPLLETESNAGCCSMQSSINNNLLPALVFNDLVPPSFKEVLRGHVMAALEVK